MRNIFPLIARVVSLQPSTTSHNTMQAVQRLAVSSLSRSLSSSLIPAVTKAPCRLAPIAPAARYVAPSRPMSSAAPAAITKGTSCEGKRVPNVTFRTRVRDDTIKPNPFKWKDVTTDELFKVSEEVEIERHHKKLSPSNYEIFMKMKRIVFFIIDKNYTPKFNSLLCFKFLSGGGGTLYRKLYTSFLHSLI